ncbi:Flagellar hook-length control protein fliK [Candidatus Nitrotoga sp. HW29]|uniref:flagellar hook-length control protein FliK n=1 Tax=Candidatus Nitrotoga sp. HW29 TaxID=2886963 RepID=UPI001EF21922|nr:flagellar hook-length control protein FliK [Candidatus Nitrotoga sp. HW29]CAH1903549.1 Flagellar hook-length control protein fliK [Candidatus Nitrotoga sp. HW29]
MQNIITPVTSPAVAAPTTTAIANDCTSSTKTFGNVLARQLTDIAQSTKTNTSDAGLPAFSASDTLLTATLGNEQSLEPQTLALDSLSTLPNDMLAALLPSNLAPQISNPTQPSQSEALSNNRTKRQASTLDSLGALPNDMLSALLPPNPSRQISISAAQSIQSEALSNNRAPSYDTSATTLGIFNSGTDSKNMTLLADAQLTSEASTQTSAPQPNVTTLVPVQTPVPNVTHLNSPIPLSVDVPFAHKAWADDFNQQIVWVTTQQGQSAELRLNPPQLGPVDVLIKIDGDQATTLFTSAHAVVRDAIEQALPKLREMLADNGIMLSNATVSDQSPREQQTKQTDQQHRKENRQEKTDEPILIGNTQIRSGRYQLGAVDTFA